MDNSGGGENEILKSKDINKMREQETASSRLENGEVQFGELKENETILVNKENTGDGERNNKAMRRSIKDYILDKPFRIRSYLRRRPIPLKRCLELDVQCGTKSFHLQINPDIDEAVYCGSPDLVRLFLQSSGLKLSDVCRLLAQARGGRNEKGEAEEDPSDEDFYDSVKSRNKREKEVRAESAKRMAEVRTTQFTLTIIYKTIPFNQPIFIRWSTCAVQWNEQSGSSPARTGFLPRSLKSSLCAGWSASPSSSTARRSSAATPAILSSSRTSSHEELLEII